MAEHHTICHRARKQTGELVAMLVEEPLPSRVNPSGRLDSLLRAHPPLIQTALAQHGHQGAANTAAKNTLTLRAETHRKLPVHTGTTKDPELVHDYAQLNVKHQRTRCHYLLSA
jgi:hypothetical protein